jgi:hypothetical protein
MGFKMKVRKRGGRTTLDLHERDILRPCLTALAYQYGVTAWRNHAGKVELASRSKVKKKSYWMQLGAPGSPDIVGFLSDSRFLGVEVKTRTGAERVAQLAMRAKVETAGGVWIVARSVDEMLAALKAAQGGAR